MDHSAKLPSLKDKHAATPRPVSIKKPVRKPRPSRSKAVKNNTEKK